MTDLPEPIQFGVKLLSVAAQTSAYKDERDGFRHRAEKAARLVVYGPERAVRRLGPLVWRVESQSRRGVAYECDLEEMTCSCTDWLIRRVICYHLLASLMAEALHQMAREEYEAAATEAEVAELAAELWGG